MRLIDADALVQNIVKRLCLDCCCETRQFYDTKKEAVEAWNRRI